MEIGMVEHGLQQPLQASAQPSSSTFNVIGWSDQVRPSTLPSITCKREAPRSDWDTGVVSVVDTSMLKSARALLAGLGARATQPGRLLRALGTSTDYEYHFPRWGIRRNKVVAEHDPARGQVGSLASGPGERVILPSRGRVTIGNRLCGRSRSRHQQQPSQPSPYFFYHLSPPQLFALSIGKHKPAVGSQADF
ncbi:hypothetical protein TIFTF001_001349 [Ficus carica]|uniref:Uncharacterized protein n=1 Tax=Ficus carica TaxID=3494 RepID=A0AA88CLX8_FICCA|nr:hypothetical protein TIFTF001_001349 [Ficus carica]